MNSYSRIDIEACRDVGTYNEKKHLSLLKRGISTHTTLNHAAGVKHTILYRNRLGDELHPGVMGLGPGLHIYPYSARDFGDHILLYQDVYDGSVTFDMMLEWVKEAMTMKLPRGWHDTDEFFKIRQPFS